MTQADDIVVSQLVTQWRQTRFLEVYSPVGSRTEPNKPLIQQRRDLIELVESVRVGTYRKVDFRV